MPRFRAIHRRLFTPRVGRGLCSLYRVDDLTGAWSDQPVAVGENSWMDTWGFLASQCLSGIAGYALAGMYFEYQNVTNPTDPVSIPSFNLSDDRSYYETLASNPTRDYLRVPLINTPTLGVAPGFTFPVGQGNQITLYALASGTVGMTGKPFSAAVNSKVCGVAVVAMPVPADRTQDVLFSRFYYSTQNQQLVTIGSQFSAAYQLQFLPPS